MKKINKYLILLIIFLMNITIVNAECDAPIMADKNYYNYGTRFYMRYPTPDSGNLEYKIDKYVRFDFYDTSVNSNIVGVCKRPDLSPGIGINNKYTLCREDSLAVTNNEKLQKENAGVKWILKQLDNDDFYNQDYGRICKEKYRGNGNKVDDYDDQRDCKRTIITATLRMYDLMFDDLNYMGADGNKTKAHKTLFNEIMSNKDGDYELIIEYYKSITGESLINSYSDIYSKVEFIYENDRNNYNTDGTLFKTEIKKLLKKALEVASSHEFVKRPEVSLIDKNESVVENSSSNISRTKAFEYTLSAKNIDFKNSTFKLFFVCEDENGNANANCKNLLSHRFYVWDFDKDDYSYAPDYLADYNLKQYIENDIFKFKVEVTGTNVNNCEDIPFRIDITYSDKDGETYIYYSEKSNYGNETQPFYVYISGDIIGNSDIEYGEKIIELPETINLCYNCEDLIKECKEGKESSCQKAIELNCYKNCDDLKSLCDKGIKLACDKYEEKCAHESCDTHIENVSCFNNENITVADGYDFDESKCKNNTNLDVLRCIVNNKDIADNDYKSKVIENNYELLKNNDYCTVSCREEYKLHMPGDILVNSGRYFRLKVQNKGLKACYTSKIDKEAFETDLYNAHKKMIEAWNSYNKWLEGIINSKVNFIPAGKSGDYVSCSPGLNPTCIRANKYYRGTWKYDYYVEIGNDKWIKREASYNTNNQDYFTIAKNEGISETVLNGLKIGNNFGEHNCKLYDTHFDGGYAQFLQGGSCGHNGTLEVLNERLILLYENALTKLQNAIKEYKSILSHYNACNGLKTTVYTSNDYDITPKEITGWEMTYTYNPTFTFDYEERYMDIALTDKLKTYGTFEMDDAPTQTICGSNVTNDYSCKENNVVGNSDLKSNNYLVCQDAHDTEYITLSTSSGQVNKVFKIFKCNTMEIKTTKARYVKQEMKVDAKYITPTQFIQIYPLGSIVTQKNGAAEIENSNPIKYGLPVSLATKQGMYDYALKIEDLGEYYDNNTKLGRLIGDRNSVLVKSLNDKKCEAEGAFIKYITIHSKFENGVYVCQYIVDRGNPEKHICEVVDDTYYDRDGNKTTKDDYKEQCTCYEEDGKYYLTYGSNPVSESTFNKVCKNIDTNKCQIVEDTYYGRNGNEVTEAEYKKQCTCYEEDGKYYLTYGSTPVSESTFNEVCKKPNPYKCQKVGDIYYGRDGKVATEAQYKKQCACYEENGNYYISYGSDPVSESTFNEICNNPNKFKCQIIDDNGIKLYYGRYHKQLATYDAFKESCCYEEKGMYYTYESPNPTTETEYKRLCCPNGKCPPSIEYKCRNVDGVYYGKDYQKITDDNKSPYPTIEAKFKAECCPDGDCPVICEVCIRNNIVYRTITPADINPNDRTLGKNWRFDKDNITTGMELKAYVTTNEIIEDNERIFDINVDSEDNEEFAIEITMDASTINYIKKYNQGREFTDNSLDCYDYKNSKDGIVYKNIFCYSKFIDKLINEKKGDIKISVRRPISKSDRNNYNTDKIGYWTVWPKAIWNVKTTQEISYYQTNFGEENNIGPSWK